MIKGARTKHHIDIMFLMVLFLIFTFSAVSVLLMAVNSYRTVVDASEKNASARTACAYIREVLHQNDYSDAIDVCDFDGQDAIKINEGDDYYIYIYENDGAMMELNTKADSGAGLSDGQKIMDINSMTLVKKGRLIKIEIEDTYGVTQNVSISIKSKGVNQ